MTAAYQVSRMVPRAHSGPIASCAWSPLHDRVVTVGQDDVIRIWDGPTGAIFSS